MNAAVAKWIFLHPSFLLTHIHSLSLSLSSLSLSFSFILLPSVSPSCLPAIQCALHSIQLTALVIPDQTGTFSSSFACLSLSLFLYQVRFSMRSNLSYVNWITCTKDEQQSTVQLSPKGLGQWELLFTEWVGFSLSFLLQCILFSLPCVHPQCLLPQEESEQEMKEEEKNRWIGHSIAHTVLCWVCNRWSLHLPLVSLVSLL